MTNQWDESPRGLVRFGAFNEVLSPPGRYINDHCFIHEGTCWHVFGIAGPLGRGCYSEGSEVSFLHATSPDLERWEVHPDVLPITGAWPETHHVYAPYVIAHDGGYFMLYTASDGQRCQRICLATSPDLFTWERHPGNPVIVPSLSWARWIGYGYDDIGPCRDPHVLRLDDGTFAAYWVAELQPRLGTNLTCVAASRSHDLLHWQEVGPVFEIRSSDVGTRAAESPCVVHKDGQFWLFFKHGWWTHVAASNDPFDFRGCEPVRLGFCHAAEVFAWEGRWRVSHCSADPRDYEYRKTSRSRGLFLGELDWPEGAYPRLV